MKMLANFGLMLGLVYYMFVTTYLYYLAIMNLRAHKDSISFSVKVFAIPIIVPGLLFDAALNIFVATVLFLDLPKEFLFTARLQRYRSEIDGWRKEIATFFCERLLNPFDIKKHC